ncbi:MAG: VOC family protein [Candidatus Eremiobacteraeota bacterium]|nr:VOC family protein [Candidatus Eremiobacteraeota bacterium]
MIKEIAFSAYPSADIAKLAKFYTDVVGLKLTEKYEEDGNMMYAEFKIGDGYFSLMHHAWMEVAAGTGCGVAFEVDDIEKTIKQLGEHGVKASAIYDTPVCRVTNFPDPEGNRVVLHQITVPH